MLSVQLAAQTVEIRPASRRLEFNTSAYFKENRPKGFFDWKSYPYAVDGKTYAQWGLFAVSGIMWGAREAYHAQPDVFEKRWGVSETSFWGSDAWRRNYWSNDPQAGHKPQWAGNVGRDIWHTFGFGSKALLFGGTFSISKRKQPLKYKIANLLVAALVQSAAASTTYQILR